jgi:hypothetical protein
MAKAMRLHFGMNRAATGSLVGPSFARASWMPVLRNLLMGHAKI